MWGMEGGTEIVECYMMRARKVIPGWHGGEANGCVMQWCVEGRGDKAVGYEEACVDFRERLLERPLVALFLLWFF